MLRIARPRRAARPRPAGGRSAPARRSLHVLLIAIGVLLLQGPSLLHLLLVPHTTCEHGELVEVARRPEVPEAREARSTQPEIAVGHGAASHEHCDALALRHRVPDVAPAVAGASLAWIEPIARDGERAETRAVPILSLAPKGSPPQDLGRADRA
jgi:hypothetical protein